MTILRGIFGQKNAGFFQNKVDPVKYRCADYYSIVHHPMWLEEVKTKLGTKGGPPRQYENPIQFRDDMRLIWENCRLYNQPETPVRKMGEALSEAWEKKWASTGIEQKWREEMARQQHEQALVSLCLQPCLPLPAPTWSSCS